MRVNKFWVGKVFKLNILYLSMITLATNLSSVGSSITEGSHLLQSSEFDDLFDEPEGRPNVIVRGSVSSCAAEMGYDPKSTISGGKIPSYVSSDYL